VNIILEAWNHLLVLHVRNIVLVIHRCHMRSPIDTSVSVRIILFTVAVSVLYLPDLAVAGRLQNPLTVFTAAGDELTLRFDKVGVEFRGRIHSYVGRNTYIAKVQSPTCDALSLGLEIYELRILNGHIRYTRENYFGCIPSKRALGYVVQYRYELAKPRLGACSTESIVLTQRDKAMSITNRCDGTLLFRDSMGWEAVLSKRGRRFTARGRDATSRWRLSIYPPTHGKNNAIWRVRGRVVKGLNSSQRQVRFRGLFQQHSSKTKVP